MNMGSASALQSAAAGATTTIAISGPDDKVCGKRTSDNISPGKGDDSDVPVIHKVEAPFADFVPTLFARTVPGAKLKTGR